MPGSRRKRSRKARNTRLEVKKISRIWIEPSVPDCINGWRFSNSDRGGKWSWLELEGDVEKFMEIYDKLRHLEQKNFTELRKSKSRSPRNKFVPIDALIKPAGDRLDELNKDVGELFSIRITKRERVWRIRDPLNIMEVLWWDPRHEVCPSDK